jgi:hypothetical protein
MSEYCDNFYNFNDLEVLSNSTKQKITPLQCKFLKYFISHPSSSAYNISHDRSFRQVKYLDSTNEVVNRLLSLKLIEDIQELSSHGAVRCKLSARGIYFLIANKILSYDQIRTLIKNYGDHILFQFFIYPYVTRDTLLKIQDSFIFLRISSYLGECCQKIEDTFDYVRHTSNQKNGHLTRQLFTWDNVPREDSDTESLRQFLQGMFPFDWLEMAEIKKTENAAGITITHGKNTALIKLDIERNKAILTSRGKTFYHFILRRGIDNQSIIDVDEFIVPRKRPVRISVTQIHLLSFIAFQQARLIDLIFSLFSAYGAASAATRALAEDENFRGALEKTKKHFDHRYNIFTKNMT